MKDITNLENNTISKVTTGLWCNNELRILEFPLQVSEADNIDNYFINLMAEIVSVSSYQKIMESDCADKRSAQAHLKSLEKTNIKLLFIKAIIQHEYNALYHMKQDYPSNSNANELTNLVNKYLKNKLHNINHFEYYSYYDWYYDTYDSLKRIIISLYSLEYISINDANKLLKKLGKSILKNKLKKYKQVETTVFNLIKNHMDVIGKYIWLTYTLINTIPISKLYLNHLNPKITLSVFSDDYRSIIEGLLTSFDKATFMFQRTLNLSMLNCYSLSYIQTNDFNRIYQVNMLLDLLLKSGVTDSYVYSKHKCFAIMNMDGNNYASLSGTFDIAKKYPDVFQKLKTHFSDIIVNAQDTKYYYDKTGYINYEDYLLSPFSQDPKNNRMFSCCERKFLVYLKNNKIVPNKTAKIYVRFNPCYMCERALTAESFKPEIIYYKKKTDKRKIIRKCDLIARNIKYQKS